MQLFAFSADLAKQVEISFRDGSIELGVVGGVHGLERVGTHVVLSYLTTLVQLLQWDTLLRSSLERTRIVLVPLVNPGGMARRRRSNPDGVDLMVML